MNPHLTAWLTLSLTPGVGAKTFQKLIAHSPPQEILSLSEDELIAVGFKPKQRQFLRGGCQTELDAILSWCGQGENRHVLTLKDKTYPSLLKQIADPPPILFVEGQLDCLLKPQIAMVGSRNATADGLDNATDFAAALAKENIIVTSGLALGIDGYAHAGSLRSGGETIAVLGSGLANVYPKTHQGLAERIIGSGALVSEYLPSAPPKANQFPKRNRIISGLSIGTLIVEATERSGSLITARLASEQGREVFVIPGSIRQPQYRGSHRLIQQGAKLVQNLEDIRQELDGMLLWHDQNESFEMTSNLDEQLKQIDSKQELPFPQLLANVGSKATPVDILAERTHIPVQDVMTQLLELELLGHVIAVSGGYIRTGRS